LLGNLLWFIAPGVYRSRVFVTKIAPALGFGSQVPELAKLPPLTIWSELLGAFLWQALLFWALDLSAAGYLVCLWAFALHWSALQYADHAWSRR
ncbi:fatty acid desaturase, partial [Klebsiella pneumoniae]|nr:fatty acid desaturase [Klebsiella pneumoniae]